MKRKDSIMSQRVAEELYKFPGTNKEIARKIGCDPTMITEWEVGRCLPSAYHLKGMYEAGCDVIYILTGRRTRNDETRG